MERMLQEHTALKIKPSLLGAAAVALALNNPDRLDYDGFLTSDSPAVPSALLEYSGFRSEEIVEASSLLEEKVSDFSTTHSRRELLAVKKKFESSRYFSVSSAFRLPKASHITSHVSRVDECGANAPRARTIPNGIPNRKPQQHKAEHDGKLPRATQPDPVEEDAAIARRRAIQQIMRDNTTGEQEKRMLIQALMSGDRTEVAPPPATTRGFGTSTSPLGGAEPTS